jgi:hypothetical protein
VVLFSHNTTDLGEAMRVLALVVALLSVPAFGADYTPWSGKGEQIRASEWVEQAQGQACCKNARRASPAGPAASAPARSASSRLGARAERNEMKRAACIAIALLLSLQRTAAAEAVFQTGNDLLSYCRVPREKESVSLAFCTGYVIGAADQISAFQSIKGATREICMPEGATISQLRDVVVRYLENNPDARHYAAGSSVLVALHAAFPCPR